MSARGITAQNQFQRAAALTRLVSVFPASRPDHGVSVGITERLLFDFLFAEHFAHADGVDDVFHRAASDLA